MSTDDHSERVPSRRWPSWVAAFLAADGSGDASTLQALDSAQAGDVVRPVAWSAFKGLYRDR
jgi:hypothetical protein